MYTNSKNKHNLYMYTQLWMSLCLLVAINTDPNSGDIIRFNSQAENQEIML